MLVNDHFSSSSSASASHHSPSPSLANLSSAAADSSLFPAAALAMASSYGAGGAYTDYEEYGGGGGAVETLANASAEQKKELLIALHPNMEVIRTNSPPGLASHARNGTTALQVTDVLPPPNHDDVQVQVMAVGYMLLFLLGTCGNVAVLTTIYQMVRSRRAQLDNTLIYMVVLSCVDFGVCLSLPFTVIDQILGFWMFGDGMCKLHAVLENFGKILSALIITAMSFDRFAGVCHSEKRYLRSTRLAICILIGMAVYALVALCPLLYNFTAREVILFQKETGPNKMTRMRIEKCTMVDMAAPLFTLFTCFLFVLCYLVPLFLVTFFYFKLLSKLHQHARQFKTSQIRSQIPLMRISLYTLAVACFYFICWTPFWVATAFAVYLEYAGEQNGAVPPVFVYCMYFIHALPFTNSAVNWILYGALNGQLQQRVRHGGVQNNHALTSVSVAQRTAQQDYDRTTLNGTMLCYNYGANNHTGTGNNTLLLKTNGGTSANGPRHSCSMEVAAAKRASITPAQSLQQQSASTGRDSLSSALNLTPCMGRRPSCPAGGEPGAEEPRRYRRRWSGRNLLNANEEEEGKPANGDIGRLANGHLVNGDVANGQPPKMANGTCREDRQKLGWPHEFDEEEALLLHSSDSVDLLLRIDSQSTTFL